MSTYISFSTPMIESLRSGCSDAAYSVNNAKYQVEQAYDNTMTRLDLALENIAKSIEQMQEDQRIAEEVLRHNEEVLQKAEEDLEKLIALGQQLQKDASRAYDLYRRAAAEQTRINHSPPRSTGDSEADAAAKRAWADEKAAAERAVRAADSAYQQIKRAQEQNARNIENLNRFIDNLRRSIAQLRSFISQLRTRISEFESARYKIDSAIRKIRENHSRYESLASTAVSNLEACQSTANTALDCAQGVYDALSPAHNGYAYSDTVFTITDLKALDRTATTLKDACDTFYEENDVFSSESSSRQREMQDAVISETAEMMEEMQNVCMDLISEINEKAEDCKKASGYLHRYQALSDFG